ncbi:MAG: hypothetical protein KF781_01355 [Chitinophagaceae bacterium]|nr:hypothetical protein [Chitinophagaceae bacterium]MCW5905381.1 hypothetical protein [Chitinophagaceae bacterium]
MIKFASPNRVLIALSVPLLIILFVLFITYNNLINTSQPFLSFAITFDLLITAPIIYFLLIRKTKVPVTTVIPILVIGLIVGTYILPKENQHFLNLFKFWCLPLIELTIFALIVLKVRATIKIFNQQKKAGTDFYTILTIVSVELVPKKVVPILTSEFATIYYGFIKWKKLVLNENEFSYHKKSGTPILLGAVIFLILIETLAIHLLLVKWSVTVAWIISGLSLYTAIQVFGFLKSLSQRPICFGENKIFIRYGFMAETEIKFEDIESIKISKMKMENNKLAKKLSIFGDLESHNIILTLNKENYIKGLYGIKRKYTTLAFYIDNVAAFERKINLILAENKHHVSAL